MKSQTISKEKEESSVETLEEEQKIVDRIYTAVMRQTLAPNTKLNESTICESFGVGRMKARRALLLLSSQGIVELKSNRGAFISSPTPRDADEVFDARIHIEPSMTGGVAKRVDSEGLNVLREHVDKEHAARAAGDRQEIIKLSGEFHLLVAKVYGNKFLVRTLRELVTRTSLIVAMFGLGDQSCCRDDEHEQIITAIKNQDADVAANLTRCHLENIRRGLDFTPNFNPEPDLVSLLKKV